MFRQILIFGLAGLLMVTTASTADAQMRRWAGIRHGRGWRRSGCADADEVPGSRRTGRAKTRSAPCSRIQWAPSRCCSTTRRTP